VADCISISNKCVKKWNFKIKKTFCELNVGHVGDIIESLDTRFVVNTVLTKMLLHIAI
jgi:hypothetical protein